MRMLVFLLIACFVYTNAQITPYGCSVTRKKLNGVLTDVHSCLVDCSRDQSEGCFEVGTANKVCIKCEPPRTNYVATLIGHVPKVVIPHQIKVCSCVDSDNCADVLAQNEIYRYNMLVALNATINAASSPVKNVAGGGGVGSRRLLWLDRQQRLIDLEKKHVNRAESKSLYTNLREYVLNRHISYQSSFKKRSLMTIDPASAIENNEQGIGNQDFQSSTLSRGFRDVVSYGEFGVGGLGVFGVAGKFFENRAASSASKAISGIASKATLRIPGGNTFLVQGELEGFTAEGARIDSEINGIARTVSQDVAIDAEVVGVTAESTAQKIFSFSNIMSVASAALSIYTTIATQNEINTMQGEIQDLGNAVVSIAKDFVQFANYTGARFESDENAIKSDNDGIAALNNITAANYNATLYLQTMFSDINTKWTTLTGRLDALVANINQSFADETFWVRRELADVEDHLRNRTRELGLYVKELASHQNTTNFDLYTRVAGLTRSIKELDRGVWEVQHQTVSRRALTQAFYAINTNLTDDLFTFVADDGSPPMNPKDYVNLPRVMRTLYDKFVFLFTTYRDGSTVTNYAVVIDIYGNTETVAEFRQDYLSIDEVLFGFGPPGCTRDIVTDVNGQYYPNITADFNINPNSDCELYGEVRLYNCTASADSTWEDHLDSIHSSDPNDEWMNMQPFRYEWVNDALNAMPCVGNPKFKSFSSMGIVDSGAKLYTAVKTHVYDVINDPLNSIKDSTILYYAQKNLFIANSNTGNGGMFALYNPSSTFNIKQNIYEDLQYNGIMSKMLSGLATMGRTFFASVESNIRAIDGTLPTGVKVETHMFPGLPVTAYGEYAQTNLVETPFMCLTAYFNQMTRATEPIFDVVPVKENTVEGVVDVQTVTRIDNTTFDYNVDPDADVKYRAKVLDDIGFERPRSFQYVGRIGARQLIGDPGSLLRDIFVNTTVPIGFYNVPDRFITNVFDYRARRGTIACHLSPPSVNQSLTFFEWTALNLGFEYDPRECDLSIKDFFVEALPDHELFDNGQFMTYYCAAKGAVPINSYLMNATNPGFHGNGAMSADSSLCEMLGNFYVLEFQDASTPTVHNLKLIPRDNWEMPVWIDVPSGDIVTDVYSQCAQPTLESWGPAGGTLVLYNSYTQPDDIITQYVTVQSPNNADPSCNYVKKPFSVAPTSRTRVQIRGCGAVNIITYMIANYTANGTPVYSQCYNISGLLVQQSADAFSGVDVAVDVAVVSVRDDVTASLYNVLNGMSNAIFASGNSSQYAQYLQDILADTSEIVIPDPNIQIQDFDFSNITLFDNATWSTFLDLMNKLQASSTLTAQIADYINNVNLDLNKSTALGLRMDALEAQMNTDLTNLENVVNKIDNTKFSNPLSDLWDKLKNPFSSLGNFFASLIAAIVNFILDVVIPLAILYGLYMLWKVCSRGASGSDTKVQKIVVQADSQKSSSGKSKYKPKQNRTYTRVYASDTELCIM